MAWSVDRMLPANRKAHSTVIHSATSKFSWGGPEMKAAPSVANSTPSKSDGWICLWRAKNSDRKAVKITYRLVRNAETAGVMSSSAIIWIRKPVSNRPPSRPASRKRRGERLAP